MRLLALEAVQRMADYLIERIDLPTEEWCKDRPGSVLSGLCTDLGDLPPASHKVSMQVVWNFWSFGDQGVCPRCEGTGLIHWIEESPAAGPGEDEDEDKAPCPTCQP